MRKRTNIFIVIVLTLVTVPIIYSFHPDRWTAKAMDAPYIESRNDEVANKFLVKYGRINPNLVSDENYNDLTFILECMGTDNLDRLEGFLDSEGSEEEIDGLLAKHLYNYQLETIEDVLSLKE